MSANEDQGTLLISIVTIVFNGQSEIENTIESVLSQTYSNIEYIIIDGGSNDATVDIIKQYESRLSYWHSKKDNGIYDAMNIGNNIATGDYIFFLNSGDTFDSSRVIEDVICNIKNKHYTLLAGRTRIFYKNEDLGIVSPSLNVVLNENSPSFSHQATFIHKSVYKKLSYNTTYAISADREYWYRVKKIENFSVLFCNLNIAGFGLGGVSNNHKNVLNRRVEDLFIEYKYEGVNFRKLFGMVIKTLLSYLLTFNEDVYFRYIYVLMNRLKSKRL